MPRFDPQWRTKYASQLCSPAEAVGVIEPGQTVFTGTFTSTPPGLCAALAARAGELSGITVVHALQPFQWDKPEILAHYRVISGFASPLDRPAARAGRFDYMPVIQWRDGTLPPGLQADVALIPVTPPDEDGWCSFGAAVFFGDAAAHTIPTLLGEIHPEFIRTHGAKVHISKFARLTEYTAQASPPVIPPRSEETEIAANIICTLVANEIVYDTCTLQFGIGDVSAALPIFLEERHGLGVHTELLPGGIPNLMERGVITNKHKAVHAGKVIASAAAQLTREELAYIDDNPLFEFHDFSHTDDLRYLLQLENFVAVNNALAIDISGNVDAETMGAQIFSGPGGQSAFAIAASTAAGGSVTVLPSSSLVNGVRHSRIMAGFEPGTQITVNRGYVDYVVTEQGIAKLRGKTLRQRAAELISVAHPDFRAELRKETARIYGINV